MMKKKKVFSVTVGIPAYNEAENIANLMDSVLRQKGDNFRLEKIIIVSDGSTEGTVEVVRRFKDKRVRVIAGRKQLGKAARLNQLYRLNRSAILITLDGDVLLKGERFIERMVKPFEKPETAVVAGNGQPVKAETLVERIYNASYQMWYEIRKDYRRGDNVNNLHGGAVALRQSFASSVRFPGKTVSDGGFLYLTAKVQGRKFRFVKSAAILFRSVNNLRDLWWQVTRNIHEKDMLAERFRDLAYEEYRIPREYQVRGIIKTMRKDPVFTAAAILISLALRILPEKQDPLITEGLWEIADSTKRLSPTGRGE